MDIKKIASFSLGPIGGAALGLITVPIIAWLYSPDEVGKIAMMLVYSNLCILIFSFGLDQAYIREYHETKENVRPVLLRIAITPGLLVLPFALTALCFTPTLFQTFLFDVNNQILISIALYFLSNYIVRFLSLTLRMEERGILFSIIQLLPKFLLLATIAIYTFLPINLNFNSLILAYALSAIATALFAALLTKNSWRKKSEYCESSQQLRKMLNFGLPLTVGGFFYWLLTSIDKVFIREFSNFEELGIYSVACNFAAVAIILQSVFSTIWAPTVYKWASEGIDTQRIDRATELILLLATFIFIGAGSFSWVVTYILPDQYKNVQFLIATCMAFPLFYTLSETTVVGLSITRKTIYSMTATITASLIGMLGGYLLIPTYGSSGAAISTAIAFWFFLIFRTELSCFCWRQIPRLKLYVVTFTCLIASIATSLFGEKIGSSISLCWFALGVIIFSANRKIIIPIIKSFYAALLNKRQSITRS